MRCAPQVHGAARDALRTSAAPWRSRRTRPPTTRWCSPRRRIVSGGNFHGAPVALAADLIVLALAQLATICERRADRLVNPALSGLPPFLTRESGLHSGYMLAQVTAAALVSELKTLAHPASVDTIPTSANREDHVSMSMARRAQGAARPRACRARCRDRDTARVPGDRSAGAAHDVADARIRARARPFARADARSRPSAGARHRVRFRAVIDGALERACGAEVK